MTGVNRYTNIQPARYTPRTLQELMIAPSYMREQHNALDAGRAELETQLAQVDPLDVHSGLAQLEQQKLYDAMSTQAEQLAKNGFTPTSKSDFIRLNKQYQQAISPTGTLGKINAAKTAYQNEKNAYITNATKLGYSPKRASINWEEHSGAYNTSFEETGNVSNIQSLYAPKYHDVVKEAKELFKEAGFSSNTLKNDLGTSHIIKDEKGQYVLTTKGYKKYGSNATQLKDALDYINNQIKNTDSEVYKSLIHQGKTTESALREIEGLQKVFEKTSSDFGEGRTISGFTPAIEIGIPFGQDKLQYEAKEASNVKITSEKLNTTLNDIITGKKYEDYGSEYRASAAAPPNLVGGISSFENNLKGKEKEDYDQMYNGLSKVNAQLNSLDRYSKEAAQIIQTYIENNKNLLRQDLIITDDFVTDYGDRSVGVSKTDSKKIIELIKNERDYRMYSINGEVYTYDNLPSDIKKKEVFNNLLYSGYYSPKNFNTDSYGKSKNKKLFVSPIVLKHINDSGESQEILVSRSQSEMESPAFKADMMFNDIFVNTNKFPGIPYSIPGGRDEISYYPNGVPIPGADPNAKYIINRKDKDGAYGVPVFLTEESLQNKLYTAYGVVLPSQVKD